MEQRYSGRQPGWIDLFGFGKGKEVAGVDMSSTLTCPACNRALAPNDFCYHQVGKYVVYYSTMMYPNEYMHVQGSDSSSLFRLNRYVLLNTVERIEELLLLK